MKKSQNPGLSFAELAAATNHQQEKLVKIDPSTLLPAGAPGVGRLQTRQSTGLLWSGSDASNCQLTAKTEARSQFRPPPAQTTRQAPAKPPASQIPKPDYPVEYRSVTRTDFQPDVLQRAGPPCRGNKLKDSGSPLPAVTDKPDFGTQTAGTFKAHTRTEWVSANSRTAGHPATHAVSYNIIHGGPAAANPYDAWMSGHDYRKSRPAS